MPSKVRTKKDLIDYSLDKKLLTKSQYSKMIKHSSNHTIKHLSYMIGQMKKGSNFNDSHKLAQLRVGG